MKVFYGQELLPFTDFLPTATLAWPWTQEKLRKTLGPKG